MTASDSPAAENSTAGVAVLAGASGFIGRRLARDLRTDGYRVRQIGRTGPDAVWGDRAGIVRALEGADLVINLAGKNVNCRYTPANRREILRSRVETTLELGRALNACHRPPELWINASTATIYRHAEDRPMTEATGEVGAGFSVDVARQWEDAFFQAAVPGQVRRVAMRMAIVLGDGPAVALLVRLARLGLGGPQHDGWWFPNRSRKEAGTWHEPHRSGGRQRFSWVHIDDVGNIIRFVRDHPEIDGAINVSAPNPSDNRTLMATLRRLVRTPVGLPAYRWMLEPAMWMLRTEPELVLKSRWVLPERLMDAGYRFIFPDLESALADVVAGTRCT